MTNERIAELEASLAALQQENAANIAGIEALGGLHGAVLEEAVEEAVVHLLLDVSARKVKRIIPDETRFTQWG